MGFWSETPSEASVPEVMTVLSMSCSGRMGSVAGVLPGASCWLVGFGLDVRVKVLAPSSVKG